MKLDYSLLPGKSIRKIGKLKKNEKCLISVITPFYNGGSTLMETANCVFSQTYPFFEWIIVDDGSKDEESLLELERVSKLDSRIKVYHKENGGPSVARDYGVTKSSSDSKYVFFIDCDDQFENNMLEVLYWTLESHPEASFAYTAMTNFGAMEFIWERYLLPDIERKENVISICSMVKKDDFLEVGGFGIKEKAMYEDWNLWLKLMAACKIPIRVNTPLFWYRTSNSGELSRAKTNHINAMKYVDETSKKVPDVLDIIQFPRAGESILNNKNYNFDYLNDMVLPMYEKSNKKTILMIVPWMVVGGADLFNLELIKRFNKNKYNFILLSTFPKDQVLRQQFYEVCSECYDMSSFLERKDYLAFISYIVESRNVDIIFNTNSSYGYAMLPFIKSKFPHIPIIDYVHSVDLKDINGGFGKYTQDFDEFIDKTYTCNNFTTNQLKNDFFKKNVDTIYIGVDEKRFDPTKFDKIELKNKYGIKDSSLVVSFVARLSEEKRPELFVKIANELKKKNSKMEFVIAGDGPLKYNVEKLISKYKLENSIHILGMVKNTEEIYAISDLTINCSSLEGLALTSYESLSMGVPVVSSDVGGQSELIDESVGFIVPFLGKRDSNFDDSNNSDEKEISLYVSATLKCLKKLDLLKKNARSKIVNNYTFDLMVKKFEKEFEEIKSNNISIPENISKNVYRLYIEKLYDEYYWLANEYCRSHYSEYNKKRHFGSYAFREKMWKYPLWRAFVKSPIWKLGKKIFKKI